MNDQNRRAIVFNSQSMLVFVLLTTDRLPAAYTRYRRPTDGHINTPNVCIQQTVRVGRAIFTLVISQKKEQSYKHTHTSPTTFCHELLIGKQQQDDITYSVDYKHKLHHSLGCPSLSAESQSKLSCLIIHRFDCDCLLSRQSNQLLT